MKLLPKIALLALALAGFGTLSAATPPTDPALLDGLQTCMANGIDAGIKAWYPDRPELGSEMSAKVSAAAVKLGPIIDTEVVAAQAVSKRVTRFYVALYFTRSPLWIRIDRYEARDKMVFLPLNCSANPDDILPGYITEFYRQ